MNPFIVTPLLRLVLSCDSTIIEPYVDRLISMLVCVNIVFVGNYKLKDQIWELIVSILDKVK